MLADYLSLPSKNRSALLDVFKGLKFHSESGAEHPSLFSLGLDLDDIMRFLDDDDPNIGKRSLRFVKAGIHQITPTQTQLLLDRGIISGLCRFISTYRDATVACDVCGIFDRIAAGTSIQNAQLLIPEVRDTLTTIMLGYCFEHKIVANSFFSIFRILAGNGQFFPLVLEVYPIVFWCSVTKDGDVQWNMEERKGLMGRAYQMVGISPLIRNSVNFKALAQEQSRVISANFSASFVKQWPALGVDWFVCLMASGLDWHHGNLKGWGMFPHLFANPVPEKRQRIHQMQILNWLMVAFTHRCPSSPVPVEIWRMLSKFVLVPAEPRGF